MLYAIFSIQKSIQTGFLIQIVKNIFFKSCEHAMIMPTNFEWQGHINGSRRFRR
ncbi:hypothetical protein [Caudoviricetes sp.]|nr:hypothetical protein [Caudoviricetes sp.]